MSNFDETAASRARRLREESQERRPQPRQDREGARLYSSDPEPDTRHFDPRFPGQGRDNPPAKRPAASGFSQYRTPEPTREEPALRPSRGDQAGPTRRDYPDQPNSPVFGSGPGKNEPPPRYVPLPSSMPEPDPMGLYSNSHDDFYRSSDTRTPLDQGPYGARRFEETPGYNDGQHQDDYEAAARRSLIENAARTPASPLEEYPHLARRAPSAEEEYNRNFAARIAAQAQEAPATSKFYLPAEPSPQARPVLQPGPNYGSGYETGYDARTASQAQYRPEDYRTDEFGNDDYANRSGQTPRWDAPADPYRGVQSRDVHQGTGGGGFGGAPNSNQLADPHGGHGALQEFDPHAFPDEEYFPEDYDLADEEAAAPKPKRKLLLFAVLAGTVAVGGAGAYYFFAKKDSGSGAARVITADRTPSTSAPANPGGRQFPGGAKSIYERIDENGKVVTAEPSFTQAAAPASGGTRLEDRIEEALRKSRPADPGSGTKLGADQPTVVRGERYAPDGTKIESGGPGRPLVMPSIGNTQGLPPPFGPAPAPGSFQAAQGQVVATPAPARSFSSPPSIAASTPPSRVASAAPATPPAPPKAAAASGYTVQLKASQNETALKGEVSTMSEKYSSALGDTPLFVKLVDLGDKGVWYRMVAGPLGSSEEADDLCKKLKKAGGGCMIRKPGD